MQRHVKTIEKLDDDLNGVAFAGGKKYVVGRTLPGDRGTENKKNIGKRRPL